MTSASPAVKPLHICELNLAIEHYSPVSGGALATAIMGRGKALTALGHRISVLSVVGDSGPYEVGNVVELVVPQRATASRYRRAAAHFRNRLHHWDWPFYGEYIRSFSAALRALRPAPDVVITHNDLNAAQYVKKILPHTPVVAWLHNENHCAARHVAKNIAATDLFVANSDYIQRWTAQTYSLSSEKITSLHYGVDEAFAPRADFLAPQTPVRVLFTGRLDPNKGPDLAADAVAQLRAEGLPVTLTSAGGQWWYGENDDTADPYLRALKGKLEAAQATHLGLVSRAEMPGVMNAHDIICVLSRSAEPFGMVALEGMASGCALVTVQRGGLPEFCQDAALYADPDNVHTVTDTLRRLVTDAGLLREYKQRAVAQAAGYTWMQHARQLERIVAGLAAR